VSVMEVGWVRRHVGGWMGPVVCVAEHTDGDEMDGWMDVLHTDGVEMDGWMDVLSTPSIMSGCPCRLDIGIFWYFLVA